MSHHHNLSRFEQPKFILISDIISNESNFSEFVVPRAPGDDHIAFPMPKDTQVTITEKRDAQILAF